MQNKNFDLESVYQCQAFDKGFVVFGSYSVASYTHETQKGYLYLQVAQFFQSYIKQVEFWRLWKQWIDHKNNNMYSHINRR